MGKIIAGMGSLILVYLVLANSKASVSILNSVASGTTRGVKTLQGR